MTPLPSQSAPHAFRTAIALFEAGVDLMRQNLKRAHHDADEGEVDRLLAEWRHHRSGAELGDRAGRVVDVVTIRVTTLEGALRQIGLDLGAASVPFALIGGLAVAARTEPRFTRNAGLAVGLTTDAEAEALIRTLGRRGYDVSAVGEQTAVSRPATVRVTRSIDRAGPVIDLLFASSGIESEVVAAAEPLEILTSLTIPVARTGHLIALKILMRDDARPQDFVELRALLRSASPADLAQAREAIALIVARGYHRDRDRDLVSAFAALAGAER